MTIQKHKVASFDNPLWPHNLALNSSEYGSMVEWLKEFCGHGDVFQRDGTWLSQKTEDPVNVEIRYFFWGGNCIQFKYEEDMIAFVLRFCG